MGADDHVAAFSWLAISVIVVVAVTASFVFRGRPRFRATFGGAVGLAAFTSASVGFGGFGFTVGLAR